MRPGLVSGERVGDGLLAVTAWVDPLEVGGVGRSDCLREKFSIFGLAGGSVLIATGTSAAHHARIPVYGGYTSDAHTYSRDGFATVGQTDLTHAVMNESGWNDLQFYYITGVDSAQARVIVRLTDSTPLLMEKQIGEGHVLLFASGFDNLTNNLPIRPAFVPFVDRTARYLSGSDDTGGSSYFW